MVLSNTTVAVVGLGLMGGSIAGALRGSARRIIGIDRDSKSSLRALELGIVDESKDRLGDGIREADLVILAVPVEGIVAILKALPALRPDGCKVMDLGSTKYDVGRAMDELPSQFEAIGGHPMCGREQSGIDATSADLFKDETFVLCRSARTTAGIEKLALAIIERIGSQSLFLEAERHDRLVAVSSHLPYIVSSLLMGRAWAMAQLDDKIWQVSASGLKDTTRLSGSSPEMMLEIMMTNRKPVLAQIDAYGELLEALADALRDRDWTTVQAMLEDAREQRREYLKKKYGEADVTGGG